LTRHPLSSSFETPLYDGLLRMRREFDGLTFSASSFETALRASSG